jgi:nucleoside-diphosphate-sugar epimerase
MSASKNILIIGGTGLIGEHISNAIVASRQHFDRIALFGKSQNRETTSGFIRHSLTLPQYVSTPLSSFKRIPTRTLLSSSTLNKNHK